MLQKDKYSKAETHIYFYGLLIKFYGPGSFYSDLPWNLMAMNLLRIALYKCFINKVKEDFTGHVFLLIITGEPGNPSD
jgi:hypothetical protein